VEVVDVSAVERARGRNMSRARQFYRAISSVDAGLILLFLIGLDTAVGSIAFPSGFSHTVVFRLLLLLLLFNLVLCTFSRLSRFRSLALHGTADTKCVIRHTGILVLHLGVVLTLIGAIVNNFYGYSSQISILKGQTVDLSEKMKLDNPVFMTLDAFEIAVNEDGSPSQFYSHVTLHEAKGQEMKRVISVNHPLVFGGMKVYQEGFEYLVRVEAITGSVHQPARLLHQGDYLRFPGTERVVKIFRYFSDFDPEGGMRQTSMKTGNPRIVYSVYENDRLIGVGAAKLGSKIMVDDDVFVVFHGVEPMTILRVKSDPGLRVTLVGGMLLVSGVIAAISAESAIRRRIFQQRSRPEEGF